MTNFICRSCRAALGRAHIYSTTTSTTGIFATTARTRFGDLRHFQDSITSKDPLNLKFDVEELLSEHHPTWSVRAILPRREDDQTTTPITVKQLHHLLRLSALPLPKSAELEEKMLQTLETQLQFVRFIREVKTDGVEPLVMLRDESVEGVKTSTVGMETKEIREALANEVVSGRNGRPRRASTETDEKKEGSELLEQEGWDALGMAAQKAGRYFVVRKVNPVPEAKNHVQPLVRKHISSRIVTREEIERRELISAERKIRKESHMDIFGEPESGMDQPIVGYAGETVAQRAVMVNIEIAQALAQRQLALKNKEEKGE